MDTNIVSADPRAAGVTRSVSGNVAGLSLFIYANLRLLPTVTTATHANVARKAETRHDVRQVRPVSNRFLIIALQRVVVAPSHAARVMARRPATVAVDPHGASGGLVVTANNFDARRALSTVRGNLHVWTPTESVPARTFIDTPGERWRSFPQQRAAMSIANTSSAIRMLEGMFGGCLGLRLLSWRECSCDAVMTT